MNKRSITAVVFLAIFAVTASGAPSGALPYFSGDPEEQAASYSDYRRGMEQLFENADRNDDGVLTVDDLTLTVQVMDANDDNWVDREEYRDYVHSSADLDNNGSISQYERRRWEPPTHPEVIRQMLNCCDSDNNAKIMKKEFMKVVRRFFEQLDWDRNRSLNSVETGDLPQLVE